MLRARVGLLHRVNEVEGLLHGKDWTRENEVTFVFPSDIEEAWLRRRIDETLAAFSLRRRPAAVRG